MVQYKSRRKICEFYVVDFLTAILGIHDSKNLKFVTVHFNSIENEISQVESMINKPKAAPPLNVNAIGSDAGNDEFSIKINHDYSDLFSGIGNMNTKIDIELKEGAIPYVAPTQSGTCPSRATKIGTRTVS